ncbi:MAG: endonuclease, partial [Opitutales bacterium]
MIARIESFFRRFRRRMSRSEWGLRFFGLSPVKGPGSEPGLLIIQIDGLSRPRLESALASGRMPFIKRLLQKQNFELRSFYSGLPSSTPGVQAELFYGVKGAVPAFSFFNRKSGHVVRMFEADAAREIEQELRKQGEGLLEGGSSYANIYQGGARESHFCAPNLGWDSLIHPGRFRAYLGALILNSYGALRVLVLLLVEFVLAIFDFGRGLIAGQDFLKELKFVPSRVGVSILLRELIVFGAQLDMSRGLPVIHLNLLGYDEQAHRRGPSSLFAFWSLKGIDDAIKRLYGTARRSHRRDYA